MRVLPIVFLLFLGSNYAIADEAETAKDDTSEEAAPEEREAEGPTDTGKRAADDEELSGAEKRAARDAAIAEMVEEYNEEVDSELDEVVCERVRVTGSRRKVEVCKTKRQLIAEREAAQRLMKQRNRAGSLPAQAQGSSAGEN